MAMVYAGLGEQTDVDGRKGLCRPEGRLTILKSRRIRQLRSDPRYANWEALG